MLLSQNDIDILSALKFDAHAQPAFEYLKYCLTWPDERPLQHLSSEGREFLYDLWIYRGFIHRSAPRNEWGLNPTHYENVWELGLKVIPQWPGFRRVNLTDAERKYLVDSLNSSLT